MCQKKADSETQGEWVPKDDDTLMETVVDENAGTLMEPLCNAMDLTLGESYLQEGLGVQCVGASVTEVEEKYPYLLVGFGVSLGRPV